MAEEKHVPRPVKKQKAFLKTALTRSKKGRTLGGPSTFPFPVNARPRARLVIELYGLVAAGTFDSIKSVSNPTPVNIFGESNQLE